MSERLVGVRPLLHVTARQDRRLIAPWIVGTTALAASSVVAYDLLFDDARSRAELAATLGTNPALTLLFGPARDLSTADGFTAWRAGALGGVFAALMAITTVVRNSRADEDSGRAELLASGVLGRQARLQTALGLALLASVALGVVSWVVTVAVGGGVADTAVLSATYVGAGWMFAGVAAVAAQVGSDARTATTLSVAVLGTAFVARGFVDASGSADGLTWATPLGWLQETRPAAGNDPWPLLLALGLTVVLAAVAFALQGRRDFGQGVLAQRPGPARGGLVTSVWGLALRLNRGSLLSWVLGLAVLGLVLGFVVTSVSEAGADSPFARILASAAGSSLVAAFLVTFLSLIGIIAGVLGVQTALRVYAEESDHRVEPLLAGALGRSRYLASNAVLAFAGPAVGMLAAGTTMGTVVSGNGVGAFGDVLAQAAATVPAVWAITTLALAVVGARPEVRLAAWLGVVGSFGLTLFGPTFSLPQWALDISPFAHVPDVTAAAPDWSGLVWVGVVTVALTAVAFAGFRRRDVL